MKKEFFIAGVQFRSKDEIEKAMNYLEEGCFLRLEPEPTNKYDSNAVKITLFSGDLDDNEKEPVFLGYIPAKFSAEVSASLEIGDVVCKVTQLNPTAKPWEKIRVIVTNEMEDDIDEDEDEDEWFKDEDDDFEDEDNLSNEEY